MVDFRTLPRSFGKFLELPEGFELGRRPVAFCLNEAYFLSLR